MDCSIKKQCGSCQYIGMDYQKQLLIKKEKCQKLFPHHFVHDVAGMENHIIIVIKSLSLLIKNMNMVYMKKHLIALYR